MKNTRKFAAMIAALTLSACSIAPMAMTASAATTVTIKVAANDVDTVNHTYAIYQIFTGKYEKAEGAAPTLTALQWGSGVSGKTGAVDTNDEAYKALISEDTDTDSRTKIKTFIATLGTLINATTATVGEDGNIKATLDDGYYYIVDTTELADGTGTVEGDSKDIYDAKSAIMVTIVGGETQDITVKKARPSVDKQIEDNEEVIESGYDGSGFNESADHAINETFQFKLTAIIPADADIAAYDYYYLGFKDTFSEGVTFEQVDKIVIDGTKEITSENVEDWAKWTVPTSVTGNSFEVITNDIKAQIPTASDWGTKEIKVEVYYSAHLNENAIVSAAGTEEGGTAEANNNYVSLEYSSNPESTGNGTSKPDETKETPKDYVWAFTYEVDNTKVDAATKASLAGAKFTLKKGDGVIKLIDNKNGSYTVAKQSDTSGVVTELVSDDNGKFNIIGLDAGEYTLTETEAPEGYALPTGAAATTSFTVDANHKEVVDGTKTELKFNNDKNAAPANTIENSFKSSLPSTGGMGTTIFYLGGGAMVAVAGVFLITKKRMGKSEN